MWYDACNIVYLGIYFLYSRNSILLNISRFHVLESLSMSPRASNSFLDSEHEMTIIESCLTFLATLMTVRTNIGKYNYYLSF